MIVKLLWMASWLTAAAFVCADPAPGQEEAAPLPLREPLASAGVPAPEGPGTVTLNFDNADLVEVIHVLARHLRLNYTIDRDVGGVVTLFSGQPVRKDDLLPIFHEVLRIHGAVAVRQGNLYRITGVSRGAELARPDAAREGGFTMRVLPVRFFPAAAMKRLLEPFLSEGGTVLEGVRGNYLVLADLPSNIRRLSEIMTLIDHRAFAGARMEMYEPRAAPARVLAREMAAAMSLSAASAAQEETREGNFAARFLPLPRINRLLVIAYSEAAWNHVKHWIERIDVAVETPGRKIFIRPVENGKAAELARVLEQVYGSDRSSSESGGSPSDPGPGRDGPGTVPAFPSDRDLGLQGLGHSTEWFGRPTEWFTGSAEAPARPDLPAGAARDRSGTSGDTPSQGEGGGADRDAYGDDADEDGIRVVAEPTTNSLVILATPEEYLHMEEVLGRLDQIPRQVLMEVLVAEVTLTDDFEFGVEYALSQGGFGSPVPEGDRPLDELVGPGFTSVVETGRDFRVFVNALMQDARVKVLSSPHLLAVDNRPARIRVGSEQPVATGTVVSREAQATTTTIRFRNVGRILTIVPQVNSEGLVNLQVRVEVSDVGERVTVGRQSFNAFNVRDAETTAVLQDGQTLVIGGIITDSVRKTRLGIPLLMDFPVLGPLFRTDLERSERTELVILITPRVIRNRREGESVTDRFLDQVRAVRRELEAGWARPSPPAPAAR